MAFLDPLRLSTGYDGLPIDRNMSIGDAANLGNQIPGIWSYRYCQANEDI